MKLITKLFIFPLIIILTHLSATEFTVGSYNCGGLSDHYDYLRAASLQNLMQERYQSEPQEMALNEKIQKLALKILFEKDFSEKSAAQDEWVRRGYQEQFERITAVPTDPSSINYSWHAKINEIITPYNIRPVVIYDAEVETMLVDHLSDLNRIGDQPLSALLDQGRETMAQRIFQHSLKFDILCLQEANYLTKSSFPSHYEVLISEEGHTKNGIAWNTERFELVKDLGSLRGRASIVQLRDKESGKLVLVASGHISGCNPYRVVKDPQTGLPDSEKGDNELQDLVALLNNQESDFMIIGMDSNVTSLHPRLNILKEAGYELDYENFLDPTCSNPHQVLNTRIDWISIKNSTKTTATIVNIPVLNVGLNSIVSNMSDHKPIAAKISY